MTSLSEQRRKQRRLRSYLFLGAGIIVLAAILGIWRAWTVYETDLPSFEQLHNIEQSVNTKIYDRNGILLREYFSENRVLTPYRDMPDHLIEMLLASEDREFYDHWGINLRRVGVVAANNLIKWEITGGASTVTQQVARMLFLNREQTLNRKIKEALTAIKLERTYSKQEILEFYLNQHYFARGAYGVAAAARTYFDKTVQELDRNECAMLIGLLKAPNVNTPFRSMEKALAARNRVLYSYFAVDGITESEFDSLRNEPIRLQRPVEQTGLAPYFTETIRQYLIDRYGEDEVYSGGLRVFTTLDAGLQQVAQSSITKRVDSLRRAIEEKYPLSSTRYAYTLPDTVDENGDSIRVHKKVQGAFVAIENETGDILAMVGGRSFDDSEFNRAVQALRQPGSAFKPFVYTAAIDNGYRPTDIVDDAPIVLEIPGSKEWRPGNYDKKFSGPMTIRDALRRSRNLVAIRLLLKLAPAEVIYYAKRMGITSDLVPVPSLAVGASEVRLVELVSSYTVFPNQGIKIPHRMITKVVDRYGRVLEDNSSIPREEVLSPQTAYVVTDMLRSVVDAGTARRARWMGFSRPAGGKTGTSNEFADNWFVGFTPQITAGTWVGFDDKTSLGAREDGARNAVPPWTEFMIAAHDSLPLIGFEEPPGLVRLDVCLESGQLATDRCLEVRNEIFRVDNQPTESCPLHPSSGRYVTPRAQNDRLISSDTTKERGHF